MARLLEVLGDPGIDARKPVRAESEGAQPHDVGADEEGFLFGTIRLLGGDWRDRIERDQEDEQVDDARAEWHANHLGWVRVLSVQPTCRSEPTEGA